MSTKIKTLVDKADRLFSEYIRKRDSDIYGNGSCCTCGRSFSWQEMDCGHWISRRVHSVRWDEDNAAIQCRHCNRFVEGRKNVMGQFLLNKLGKERWDDLFRKENITIKMTEGYLNNLISEIKYKISRLP